MHTPTVFINGFEMPGNYRIENMSLLINQLIENITPLPVVANAEK